MGETKLLSPRDLVPRLGLNEKRVRAFLRQEYPREQKGGRWEITPELAKKIEKAYKAKVKAKEAEKKLQIEKKLSGVSNIEVSNEANVADNEGVK